MLYRKKPVTIQAVQLLWSTWEEMCVHADVGPKGTGKPTGCFVGEDGKPDEDMPTSENPKIGLLIPTLEGPMLATEGDWVIRGVKGELYPCKDDIFQATYESATNEPVTTIPTKEFNKLKEEERFLNALRGAGVDNWDGYDLSQLSP